jgi:hypothetical protein
MFVEDTLIPMSGTDAKGNPISWNAILTNTIDLSGGITDQLTEICDICRLPRKTSDMVKSGGKYYCYISGCVNDLTTDRPHKRGN